MNRQFKPAGYNSVSPYLVVNGAQKMIDLLKEIFNTEQLRRYDMPDGSVMHAEFKIDDSVIMIGDASEQFPANKHLIHVYVPDVENTFNKAIALGCKPDQKPIQRDGDPDLRGSFIDFAGNVWSVATQLSTK
jgi:PhnB protein